jgi:hypothetical protein
LDGQGHLCRYRKFRLDGHRRFAVTGNFILTSNGILPLQEIPFGRATAFCRYRKFHFDEQRRFAVTGNFILTSNGVLPLQEIPSGRPTAFCRYRKFRLDGHRRFVIPEIFRQYVMHGNNNKG